MEGFTLQTRGLRKVRKMPIKKCQSKGKTGYKYGSKGKCYTGSSAKSKAGKQGRAIKASQAKRSK
jgi:hypothetical protein